MGNVILAIFLVGLFAFIALVVAAQFLGVLASILIISLFAIYWVAIYPAFILSKGILLLVYVLGRSLLWLIKEVVWAVKNPIQKI
ncbi:MAG: hypothetical protein UY08_C0011G0007 [Candidatus Gottesmanbacteria bacterium GW2011_GWA1_47_8]|uniref:Uncharacterized protein n=1 Tax=Candidatus Gottesmanbacteria bacterium GW2011_GWA1_47_8 TaxID=1618438 RepID=A0A0G1WET1_9BACT|nr:MAG: hypothetical protein UY08_C0011G0007 [Candidatus Gottesmanbacteria bacterium GW2011_GWA1_47_8]